MKIPRKEVFVYAEYDDAPRERHDYALDGL